MASPIGSTAQLCCSKFVFSKFGIIDIFVCHHGFVHDRFFRSLDPCVIAVCRDLLELIFVRNGSHQYNQIILLTLIVSLTFFVLRV